MKIPIIYNGQEIFVDAVIKQCLDELSRQERVLERKNRRHEIIVDALVLPQGVISNNYIESEGTVEYQVEKILDIEKIKVVLNSLADEERKLLLDRFVWEMKYRELSAKYGVPVSTLESRIKRILLILKQFID